MFAVWPPDVTVLSLLLISVRLQYVYSDHIYDSHYMDLKLEYNHACRDSLDLGFLVALIYIYAIIHYHTWILTHHRNAVNPHNALQAQQS